MSIMKYPVNFHLFQTPEKSNKMKIIVSRSHRGQIETILNEKFSNQFDIVIAAGAGKVYLKVWKPIYLLSKNNLTKFVSFFPFFILSNKIACTFFLLYK